MTGVQDVPRRQTATVHLGAKSAWGEVQCRRMATQSKVPQARFLDRGAWKQVELTTRPGKQPAEDVASLPDPESLVRNGLTKPLLFSSRRIFGPSAALGAELAAQLLQAFHNESLRHAGDEAVWDATGICADEGLLPCYAPYGLQLLPSYGSQQS